MSMMQESTTKYKEKATRTMIVQTKLTCPPNRQAHKEKEKTNSIKKDEVQALIAAIKDIKEKKYEDEKQDMRESQEKVFERLADIENHLKEAEQEKEEFAEGYKRKYEDEQREQV